MALPQAFCDRMEKLLGAEYPVFFQSYEQAPRQGLRLNTQKLKPTEAGRLPFALTPVPWAEEGFTYGGNDRPGRHPLHEAGVYYIQEPSAMAAAHCLAPQPGERVLDLCAAPGGKTTHLGALMENSGLLISNEIHPQRARILSSNVERMGLRNCLVLNETPQRLAERFTGYFDRVLCDAPCSGEGMFRKDETAVREWSEENVEHCAERQREVLACAVRMVRPGGFLLYSTCTFAPQENEQNVAWLMREFPWMKPVRPAWKTGFSEGRPDWADGTAALADTVRLWPHHAEGEGHFMALLQSQKEPPAERPEALMQAEQPPRELTDFIKQELNEWKTGSMTAFGQEWYELPLQTPELKGLKVLRPGLHMGSLKKNRFEPAHALATALERHQAVRALPLSADGEAIMRYLHGEALETAGDAGWTLVTTEGFPIGWAKVSGGMAKNHYPKGLRILY